MKAACLVLSLLIFVAIMAVCVMVKFATDITVEERKREFMQGDTMIQFSNTRTMGLVSLSENPHMSAAERFPYVAAVTRNTSTLWSFACFASIILLKWVVTSAHCRRPSSTHRVLLYYDLARNYTHTYPILFWRLHENYNDSTAPARYDIAVAKLNMDLFHPFTMKSSMFDETEVKEVEASVWKTMSTMDRRLFLTNDIAKYEVKIVNAGKCFESYGVELDTSMICIDVSDHSDCFIHEFGPLFAGDKIVGILAVQPRDCGMKLAIFTNVSYYANWIFKSTQTSAYG